MLNKLGRKKISIVVSQRKVTEAQIEDMAAAFNKLVVDEMVENIKAGDYEPQEGQTPPPLLTWMPCWTNTEVVEKN